jgi:hypothetical protein
MEIILHHIDRPLAMFDVENPCRGTAKFYLVELVIIVIIGVCSVNHLGCLSNPYPLRLPRILWIGYCAENIHVSPAPAKPVTGDVPIFITICDGAVGRAKINS